MEAYRAMAKTREETHIFYDRDEAIKWLGYKP